MFLKLPSIWFWGAKLGSITNNSAEVLLPYNWRSKNPFKSIYFSAQAGAAELSTGLLILQVLSQRKDISMLVTSAKLNFIKKATSTISFTCLEGKKVTETIESLKDKGDTATIILTSIGTDIHNEPVSEMKMEWSFKKRN